MNRIFDMVVIGGGINGTGIAADAAGRGLKVALVEQNDLASATSSNSSKLIHGGLRYLEHYEFSLVRKALAEREVLLQKAPHIIKPLIFRLPHQRHLRPSLMIRAGLFLYDHLAKRVTLPASKSIKFNEHSPLINSMVKGFEYSDGWVDDARLVILNALAAQENGGAIYTRTKCVNAERQQTTDGLIWQITLEDTLTGETSKLQARSIINASGPWVAQLFSDALTLKSPQNIRLVKGSHIIVPRLHDQAEAYMLQNEDQRIVFVIPFEEEFSLIGTTDVEYHGDPSEVNISEDEINYLINISNAYFKKKISPKDIVATFSGVRPLFDDESVDAQAVTRDYTLELADSEGKSDGKNIGKGEAPILSVFGGKITTYRKLAETAVNKLAPYFKRLDINMGDAWTETSPLPGGNFIQLELLTQDVTQTFPWLPERLKTRLIRRYGTRIFAVLDNAKNIYELGLNFGADLYQKEVDFLIHHEWAITIDDILWRRTKVGLYLSEQEKDVLTRYIANTPIIINRNKSKIVDVA